MSKIAGLAGHLSTAFKIAESDIQITTEPVKAYWQGKPLNLERITVVVPSRTVKDDKGKTHPDHGFPDRVHSAAVKFPGIGKRDMHAPMVSVRTPDQMKPAGVADAPAVAAE